MMKDIDEQIKEFQKLFHYCPKKAQDYIKEIQLQDRKINPEKYKK